MPNLLPQNMRSTDGNTKKATSSRPVVRMHVPDEEREDTPTPPPVRKPVSLTPATSESSAPVEPQKPQMLEPPKREVITQTADVVSEEKKGLTWRTLFHREHKPVTHANGIDFAAPSVDTVVLNLFWDHVNRLSRVVLTLIAFVAVAYAGMFVYQLRLLDQVSAADAQLQSIEREIASYRSDQSNFKKLQQRAEVLRSLLGNHLYWSAFFDFLEMKTLPTVKYVSLTADTQSGVTLNAEAATYQQVAEQLALFTHLPQSIADATVLTAQWSTDRDVPRVLFTIDLRVTPSLIKPHGGATNTNQ